MTEQDELERLQGMVNALMEEIRYLRARERIYVGVLTLCIAVIALQVAFA